MKKIARLTEDRRIAALAKDYLSKIDFGTLTFIVQDSEIIQLNIKEVFKTTSQNT
jgi:hypothetical protein